MKSNKGSNSLFADQEEFMKAGDAAIASTEVSAEMLAVELIEEEFEEFMDENCYLSTGNLNSLKEAIDLIYVCCQYMNTVVGAEKAQKLWDTVHAHNMSKTQGGKLIKRADGKILKPEGFDKEAWVKGFLAILDVEEEGT